MYLYLYLYPIPGHPGSYGSFVLVSVADEANLSSRWTTYNHKAGIYAVPTQPCLSVIVTATVTTPISI